MVFFRFFSFFKTDESYIHTSYAFDFRLRNKAQRKPLAVLLRLNMFQFKVVHPQNLKLVLISKHDEDDGASLSLSSSSSNEAANRIE